MCRNDESKGIVKFFKITGLVLLGIIVACGFALLFGLALKALWNWLMPAIFGLGVITYWQAVGLFILAKLLFGGFGKGHGHKEERHPPFLGKFKGFRDWHDKCHGRGFDPHVYHEETGKYHEFWEKEGRAAFDEYLAREKDKK